MTSEVRIVRRDVKEGWVVGIFGGTEIDGGIRDVGASEQR